MGDLISRAALLDALANKNEKGEIFAVIQDMESVDEDVLQEIGAEYWGQFEPEATDYKSADMEIASATAFEKFGGKVTDSQTKYILYLAEIIDRMQVKIVNLHVQMAQMERYIRDLLEREEAIKKIMESGYDNGSAD